MQNDTTNINIMIASLTDRQRREFAVWCAERVRHLMTDSRSTAALDVAARHLRGEATDEELDEAGDAARAAARDAAWTAEAADGDAAWAAAAAALAAAWHAAWAAARAAAHHAELASQREQLQRMLAEVKS
jgi:hypothetical protein